MRNQLSENLELAQETLKNVQDGMKVHYDLKSANRDFEAGEQVLVLLPTSSKSLEAQWKGPYRITEKLNEVDYLVASWYKPSQTISHKYVEIIENTR